MDAERVDLDAGFGEAAGHDPAVVSVDPTSSRQLRLAAEHLVARVLDPVPTLLDIGCGPGSSTRELLRAARRRGLTPRIIGVDASPAMVELARARRWPEGVGFVSADAGSLAGLALPRAHAALARQLRSRPDLDATLAAIRGVLLPGGTLVVPWYPPRKPPAAEARWRRANQRALPLPPASIADSPTRDELIRRLSAAGFTGVHSVAVGGRQRGGVLHLVRGEA